MLVGLFLHSACLGVLLLRKQPRRPPYPSTRKSHTCPQQLGAWHACGTVWRAGGITPGACWSTG